MDPSAGHVAYAAEDVRNHRAKFEFADATHLPPGPFDAVVSALVLNFAPDPAAALRAMREAAPGGSRTTVRYR